MREKTVLGSVAGLLVGGGASFWHEGIIWAYGKALDGISASIGVAQVTWLEALPWWNIIGGCSTAAGVGLATYVYFREPRASPTSPKAISPSPLPLPVDAPVVVPRTIPEQKPVPEQKRYLSDAVVVSGAAHISPEFRARFARNGQNGTFYIEHSFHVEDYGAGWTLPRKIAVFHKSRFAAGEMVSFAVVSPNMTSEGTRWFFGPVFAADGKPATDMLNLGTHFQGRVTFLSDENTEEHCYFIVSTTEKPDMPTVTGEHMFSHMQLWERKEARNGTPDSLFP